MSAKKGSIPWNKGRKCPEISKGKMGHIVSTETRAKISQTKTGVKSPRTVGDKHWNWKGDSVGYFGVHNWVYKIQGRPKICENCGSDTNPKYEWANLSGEYKRNVSDWAQLCYLCHDLIDKSGGFTSKLTPEEV